MDAIRRHFHSTIARLDAETAGATADQSRPASPHPARTPLRALLASHQQQLKQTKSLQRKLALKGQFLPDYEAHVAGVLQADQPVADPIVLQVLIWRIDAGDAAGAVDIARWALRHGIDLPQEYGFRRTLPEILLEELSDGALNSPDPGLVGPLSDALTLAADVDMVDEIRAKAHKALGRLLTDSAPAQALAHFEQANALHAGCGVKGDIRSLLKLIGSDLSPADPAPEDQSATGLAEAQANTEVPPER